MYPKYSAFPVSSSSAISLRILYGTQSWRTTITTESACCKIIPVSAVSNYGDEIHVRLPLNIIDYSADAPVITLSQYLVYTKKGQTVDPLTYITSITDSNGIEMNIADVKVSSQVNFDKEGAGQMVLEITNKRGVTGFTYLTVIVEA